jgi:PhnB protein
MAVTRKKSAPKKKKAPSKKAKVHYIPKGMPTLMAGFAVSGCAKAIDWLTSTFGMKVKDIYRMPDGGVAHCELRLGDSIVMCADPQGQTYHVRAAFYVKDCDAVFARAVAAGATVKRPLTNQFYGDRSGSVVDPFGNEWNIATHVEDVSKKEMDRRMAAMMSQAAE